MQLYMYYYIAEILDVSTILALSGGWRLQESPNVNKPYINTVQSPINKIHINTESLHFIRLS